MSSHSGPDILNRSLVLSLDASNSVSFKSGETAWNDLSRNSYNGINNSGVTFDASGRGSLDFNGSAYWVTNAPFNMAAQGITSVTYNFWLNSNTVATNQTLLGNGTQTSSGFVWIYRNSNTNSLSIQYGNLTTFVATSVTQFFTNFNNTWVNLTIVMDYANSGVTWYRNGVLYSGPNALTGVPQVPINRNYVVGSYNGASNFFTGSFNIVQLFNRALTSDEVFRNYSAYRGRFFV